MNEWKELVADLVPIVNKNGYPDEVWAETRFRGLGYDSAVRLFRDEDCCPFHCLDDFAFMAEDGFLYYFSAFADALERSIEMRSCDSVMDMVSVFLCCIESRAEVFFELKGVVRTLRNLLTKIDCWMNNNLEEFEIKRLEFERKNLFKIKTMLDNRGHISEA